MTSEEVSHYDHGAITELLMGHRVSKVSEDTLTLDDGTRLTFVGSADCCAYYDLVELNGVDNVITNVEFVEDPAGDEYPDGEGFYRIFVFADNAKVNLVTFEGTDSNGCYGTGYTINVRKP